MQVHFKKSEVKLVKEAQWSGHLNKMSGLTLDKAVCTPQEVLM